MTSPWGGKVNDKIAYVNSTGMQIIIIYQKMLYQQNKWTQNNLLSLFLQQIYDLWKLSAWSANALVLINVRMNGGSQNNQLFLRIKKNCYSCLMQITNT